MVKIILAIHGGAGAILRSSMTEEKEKAYKTALETSLNAGYSLLEKGFSSLDAVQAAVIVLEDSPLFNAGKGSVFTHDGAHEMDASIMDGRTLKAGAVAGVQNIRNPVALARKIMDHSEYVFLAGRGAEDFALQMNIPTEEADYFFDQFRYDQLMEIRNKDSVQLDHSNKKFGTVGAVALDVNGNLAAATSTGGMTNKRYNRIGDSPIIGSGNYANNKTCAVSCTGHGEYFIRYAVSHEIVAQMKYKKISAKDAVEDVINRQLKEINGEGAAIILDKSGRFTTARNSEGLYRGWITSDGTIRVRIYDE